MLEKNNASKLVIKWSTIDSLGKNKTLSSSYIWVIIVPLLAKFLSNIQQINMFFICNDCFVNLELPFSWVSFYYSALCIAIGKAIYTIWCPKIISKYQNYQDFLDEGRGVYSIRDLVCDAYNNKIIDSDFVNRYLKDFYIDVSNTKDDLHNLRTRIIDEKKDGDAFFRIRDAFETHQKYISKISFAFYSIGIVLFLMVIVDNTMTVFVSYRKLFINFN